jgi:hypothetical protein
MTAEKKSFLLPASAERPSNKQKLFLRYFTGILIDLTVLNLFVEYSKNVVIDSFTISLLAAVLLQVLLKATIALEHLVANFFQGQTGRLCEVLRFFTAWLILFGSKFVILEALALRSATTSISAGRSTEIVVRGRRRHRDARRRGSDCSALSPPD